MNTMIKKFGFLAIGMFFLTSSFGQIRTLPELIKAGDLMTLKSMMADESDLCIMDETQINTQDEAIERIQNFMVANPINSFEVLHKGKSDANASRYNVYKLVSNDKMIRAFVYFEEDGSKSWIKEIRFDKFN